MIHIVHTVDEDYLHLRANSELLTKEALPGKTTGQKNHYPPANHHASHL